jgi:hypothetical protein
MSYFLCLQLIGLLTTAKTVSQQKKGHHALRGISKFTAKAFSSYAAPSIGSEVPARHGGQA